MTAAAETPRDSADVLAGVVRVTLGGQQREMRVLSIRESRDWKRKLMTIISGIKLPDSVATIAQWGTAVAMQTGDSVLEMLLAWDRDNALSGERTASANRRWVEEHASDRELYNALIEVLKAAFPFAEDPWTLVAEMISQSLTEQQMGRTQAMLAAMAQPASTSGPSADGGSAAPAN